MLIVRQFNAVHISLYIITALLIVLITFLLRKREEKTRILFILALSLFNIIFFVVYKVMLYLDPTYTEFNIWKELPLHLCNINLFIIPLGVWFDNKFLKAFGFYVAPFAAVLALTTPSPGFTDYSIFAPRCIGYYGTHMIIIIQGVIICTLGFIKPKFKVIPTLMLTILALSLAVFGINKILYLISGVKTNYFYTVHDNDISILKALWNIIPCQYLYLLPGFLAYGVYAVLLSLPFELVERHKLKSEAN